MLDPSAPAPAARRDLDALAAHHALGEPALEALFALAAARPTRAEDRRFLRRVLGLAGVLSLAAGVVFFVAANWAAIGALGRFALVEGLLALAGAAALLRPPPDRIGRLALLGAFLLTGALLALFGQTYQTGADVYELFLAWAALGLPIALVAGSSAAWGAWVVVVNVMLALLVGLPLGNVLWTLLAGWHLSTPALLALATAVDVALWAVCQAAAGTRLAGAVSLWLERLAVAGAAAFASWGAVLGIFSWGGRYDRDGWTTSGSAVLALTLVASATFVATATLRRRRDVFPIAALGAVVIAAGTAVLVRAMDRWHLDAGALLLLTAWLVGSSTAAGWVLMSLVRRWRAEGTLA
jgi:uncharacterized membrane protein